MIIGYGSPAHLLALAAVAGVVFLLYRLLRNRSPFTQRAVLIAVMGVNVIQHLFKSVVWPHLAGTGFHLINTAYNACAFLILITPVVSLLKSPLLKQFLSYVGTVAGTAALLVPHWFIGQTVFQWEYFRSWFCHTLLIVTSLLPALFGGVSFRFRDGWKFGLLFLSMLAVILLDNVLCVYAGLYESNGLTLEQCLDRLNPVWMMHPPENFPALTAVFRALSPAAFAEIPILWYSVPLYFLITVAAYLLGYPLEALQNHRNRSKSSIFSTRTGHACRKITRKRTNLGKLGSLS